MSTRKRRALVAALGIVVLGLILWALLPKTPPVPDGWVAELRRESRLDAGIAAGLGADASGRARARAGRETAPGRAARRPAPARPGNGNAVQDRQADGDADAEEGPPVRTIVLVGDGGPTPDAGAPDAGAPDGGESAADDLRRRLDELSRRQAASEEERRRLAEQVAELQRQLDARQAAAVRSEQSRAFRTSQLSGAIGRLGAAHDQLVAGSFDAAAALLEAREALTATLSEAQAYGSGSEIDQAQRALGQVRLAIDALARRDFYEALRSTEAATELARLAFEQAQSAPLPAPP